MIFEEHFFEFQGVKSYYIASGNGYPVMFLHGGGLGATAYRRNLEILAKEYFVIVPDNPCFGKSSIPAEPWSFKDYANYYDAFIKSLKFGSVALIGHSFGGGIAFNLAAKNKNISKLVLIDSAGIVPAFQFSKLSRLLAKAAIDDFISLDKEIAPVALKDLAISAASKLPELPLILETVEKSMWVDSLSPASDSINIPTMILWGEDDDLFPLSYAETFHNKIAGSILKIIPKAGHSWCIFEPEKLYDIVADFIR